MHWLLTWTTYGSRLPGDARGFVSGVRTETGRVEIHNQPGEPIDADVPALHRYAASIMTQAPVRLTAEQAETLVEQVRETAAHRAWQVHAIAAMPDHVHLVVETPDDVSANKLLTDFKAYATRRLNYQFAAGRKLRWWTERGSTRALKAPSAVAAAIEYVAKQHRPLVVWLRNK